MKLFRFFGFCVCRFPENHFFCWGTETLALKEHQGQFWSCKNISSLEYVNIKNRSLCFRGRAQKGRIWDNSVMKWLSKKSTNHEQSMCCIYPETRFRETWRKLIVILFRTLSRPSNSLNPTFHDSNIFVLLFSVFCRICLIVSYWRLYGHRAFRHSKKWRGMLWGNLKWPRSILGAIWVDLATTSIYPNSQNHEHMK